MQSLQCQVLNVPPSGRTVNVHEIAKLLPYFSEHVWSQCCCYATYRQTHETHECALTHGTCFDS